ncbi:winged helix-turn-helix domain-containing protein [Bradyrhizobium genosp. L]|uniref:winged helix-turn-helix domain-containing protein n=1 Tax=Bradyrhizobium genosp. L TaxID=83637 RepID=UPI0018A32298|nr:winged helix-turn-helix domain-containing protein [Bradyrhizobium genosp. L]QPF83828.1 winged helix-turn-helix domain-containing protein [Bradyrhizobium genosp. L]
MARFQLVRTGSHKTAVAWSKNLLPHVVSTTPQVFDFLRYLIRNREHVVSRDDIINTIWNGRSVSDAALTTRLNTVRTAIGDSREKQRFIKTLARKGFRFVAVVREAQDQEGGPAANQIRLQNKELAIAEDPPLPYCRSRT